MVSPGAPPPPPSPSDATECVHDKELYKSTFTLSYFTYSNGNYKISIWDEMASAHLEILLLTCLLTFLLSSVLLFFPDPAKESGEPYKRSINPAKNVLKCEGH